MAFDKIIVLDPESKSMHLLRQILTGAGYAVLATNKGERAIQLAADEQPDLVLTEACRAGDLDGIELVRRIRQFSEVPVIVLDGVPSTECELSAFDAGADDYLTKPYDARVLLARVKAALKRRPQTPGAPVVITCRDLEINQASRQVRLSGMEIYLTETEYNLLLELARHRDKVLLHEQLLVAVWGPNFRGEINYLRSYVHMLRRKLEANPGDPHLIVSRPGIGYMLQSERS